jgi:hypothetical protein
MPAPSQRSQAIPIRRSPNGAGDTRPQPGRDRPERAVAINRNAWSQSIGIGGRNQPVRAVRAARTWIRREVTIEFQGRNASGRYSISRGTITVSTVFYGRKSTRVGGSTPASLARIMLRELGRVLINPVQ